MVAAIWQVKGARPYHIDLRHNEIVDELARKIRKDLSMPSVRYHHDISSYYKRGRRLVDFPGVNAQEKTKEELMEELRIGTQEMFATGISFEPDWALNTGHL